MSQSQHSVEYIFDERFDWWNLDFLRLVKTRAIGDAVATRLVGEGHWSLSLVRVFADLKEVTGV